MCLDTHILPPLLQFLGRERGYGRGDGGGDGGRGKEGRIEDRGGNGARGQEEEGQLLRGREGVKGQNGREMKIRGRRERVFQSHAEKSANS